MASKIVEIVLKASDQFSDTTKKAELQFAAMKIGADNFNASVQKLQNLHPGLSQAEVEAVATALQNAAKGADGVGRSFANAGLAGRGLSQIIGIELPRAVTSFLAQSTLIGPALSAAFSGVAIVGLLEGLAQIPKAYDKIVESLTGWDQKAKDTYKNILDANQKAYDDLIKYQSKLAEITGGPKAGIATSLKEYQRLLELITAQETRLRDLAKTPTGASLPLMIPGAGLPGIPSGVGDALMNKSLIGQADELHKQWIAIEQIILDLQKQGTLVDVQAAQTTADKVVAIVKAAQDKLVAETQRFRMDQASKTYLADLDELIHIADERLRLLDEQNKFWSKELLDYRIKGGVEPGTMVADQQAKAIIEAYKKAQEEHKKFVASFQEEIGKLWDDFFLKGKGAFADLVNLGKDLIQSLTRNVVESLATNLAFGKSGSGGLLGGLIGMVSKHASAGAMSEAIPGGGGLASSGGLLGALGGLFKGKGPDFVGPIQPATGLAGMLGLGGGAGLLGLGAATIPVIGGAIAAGVAIAEGIFGHHHDAPFTRDPNSIQNTREYLFYSGVQDFAAASKDMLNFTHQLNTLPTGTLVKNGLPVALASSNQFRRDVASVLNQDL